MLLAINSFHNGRYILNVFLCASKLTFLASLGRKDYFKLQTHKRGDSHKIIFK